MSSMTLFTQRLLRLLLFCFLFASPALAVDTVDVTFATSGFAIHNFGFGDDEALALAVQPDGKYIIAGYSNDGAVANMTVARYLASGVPDVSFGDEGMFYQNLGNGDSIARSVVVQKDGRILLAVSSHGVESDLVIIALNPDGYLDPTFGDDGQVVFGTEGEEIIAADIKTAEDGSLVIEATAKGSDSARHILFAKIDATGNRDDDFGDSGVIRQEQAASTEIHALAVLDGDKILAAGGIDVEGIIRAGLLRRNSDGTADGTFGNEGELLLELEGESAVINDIWVEPGGELLLAGFAVDTEQRRAFVLRLKSDGSIDEDFAGGTGVFYSSMESDTIANAVAVQPDGTVVLAGFSSSEQGKDVVIWSLSVEKRETALEPEFTVSRIITDIGSDDDMCYAMTPLPSGQVLAAGSFNNGSDRDFALIRYTSALGNGVQQVAAAGAGVVTGRYRVTTRSITDVTRVGAVSGGLIYDNYHGLSCKTSCTARCEDVDGDANKVCYDSCFDTCGGTATVKLRGVCYNVVGSPVYLEKSVDDGGDAKPVESTGESTGEIFPKETTDNSFIYDIVRFGQTEDGSGIGDFTSDVQDITPGVTYYLRAFAVMEDGSVIYGNEVTFTTKDACFIATAAYGSLLDVHVNLLREFRDTYLMHSNVGRLFVATYYHFSPPLAFIIRDHLLLRGMVRILLYPFILLAFIVLKTTLLVKVGGGLTAVMIAVCYTRFYDTMQKE